MCFDLYMAWRFLKESKVQTLLTLLAITIGVGVQIFLSSLIGGLQSNLLESTVGNSFHIKVAAKNDQPKSILSEQQKQGEILSPTLNWTKEDRDLDNWQFLVEELNKYTGITAVSPIVNESAFLSSGKASRPVLIKGIDPQEADNIYKYKDSILSGESELSGSSDILIGRDLAEELNVGIKDNIQISTSEGNMALFIVQGIFDLKVQSINSSWIFMDLRRSQSFLQKNGNISMIEIQVADVFASDIIAQDLRQRWPDLEIDTWQTGNRQLLSGLKSQSSSSIVIQFFVQLSVLLGISSVLAVSVIQKSKLIGILKAMGLRNQRVGRIFIFQGGLLGFFGSFFGCVAGYLLIRAFLYFTEKSEAAIIFDVPFSPGIFLTSASIAIIASILAAFIPARSASLYNPIEVIRIG